MINSCRVKQALIPQKRHCNQESDDVFQKILKTCLVVSLIVLVITFEILLTTTLSSSSSLIKSTATITLKQTKKIIPLLTTTISEAVMTTATAATVSYDDEANSMSVIYTKFINEDQLILSNLAFANSNNNIIIQCSTSRSRVDNRDNNQRRKDKLIHSTFRINQFVIKSLEEEANKRRVSLGSLVNSILENYVSSEMYFEQLGFLLVSKDFLRKTFNAIPSNNEQNTIDEFAKELGNTVAKEYVSYFFPEVNSRTLAEFLDIWFRRFQCCQHRVTKSSSDIDDITAATTKELHHIAVNHDININFSIALKAMMEGFIEPIIKRKVEFKEITSNAISFSFEI
jgi:hypothetical protein